MSNRAKIISLLASKEQANIDLAYQLAKSQELNEEFYYLIQFGDMMEYIRKFDTIYIAHYRFNPPNQEEIQFVKENLSENLPKDVLEFYTQCNGIELYWYDKRKNGYKYLTNYGINDFEEINGAIEIPGIKQLYTTGSLDISNYGEKGISIEGKELSPLDMQNTFHDFDTYSTWAEMFAYINKEDYTSSPILIMSDKYRAYFEHSRLIDIPSYLELAFYSCGTHIRRKFLYAMHGYKQPVIQLSKGYFKQFEPLDLSQEEVTPNFPIAHL